MKKHRPELRRIILLNAVLILSITACGVEDTATTVPLFTATYVPVIVPTLGPIPTLDPKILTQDIEIFTSRYDIDLNCLPICWHQFIPGQTPMSDVYTFFEQVDHIPNPGSTRGDLSLPLNSTSVGMGDVDIDVFSDDSTSVPKLRVIDFGMGLGVAGLNPGADKWLPQNILKRSGKPTHIAYGIDYPRFYYLLMSFDGWALLYTGLETATDNNLLQDCPDSPPTGITIWRYAPSESDALTVIRSLRTYPDIGGTPELDTPPAKWMTITTDKTEIDAIVNPLIEGRCIELHYAKFF